MIDSDYDPHNPELYVNPVGGGWDGYQAACHTCDWRGTRLYQRKADAQSDPHLFDGHGPRCDPERFRAYQEKYA